MTFRKRRLRKFLAVAFLCLLLTRLLVFALPDIRGEFLGRKLLAVDTHFAMADILEINRSDAAPEWTRFCVIKPLIESGMWRMNLVNDKRRKSLRIRKSLVDAVCPELTGEELGGVCSGIFRPLKKQTRDGKVCLLGELLQ